MLHQPSPPKKKKKIKYYNGKNKYYNGHNGITLFNRKLRSSLKAAFPSYYSIQLIWHTEWGFNFKGNGNSI